MQRYSLILVFSGLLILQLTMGCKFRTGEALTKFKEFEVSYRNPVTAKYFSILFTNENIIILKKYTLTNGDSVFYSTLTLAQRTEINEFVRQSDLLSIDSMEDLHPVNDRFALYLDYGNERHSIYIHSLNPPRSFQRFTNCLNKIIDSSKFVPLDKTVEFKDDKLIHKSIKRGDWNAD